MTRLISLCLILMCIFSSCYSKDRDQQALEIMRNTLKAVNENDLNKFYGNFDENSKEQSDEEQLRADVKKIYYLLTKYHDNNIDSLYWTTDHKVDEANKIEYVIELFEGFDTLSGYKKATLHLYFWNFEEIKVLGGYRLDIDIDAKYRGKLLDEGKLPTTDELVQSLKK